jgi:hypothetical protein
MYIFTCLPDLVSDLVNNPGLHIDSEEISGIPQPLSHHVRRHYSLHNDDVELNN